MIGLVILLLSLKKSTPQKKSELSSELEGFDLIEFQQNLKNLIEELNSSAQSSIKEMEGKNSQLEETLRSADARINELKYLLERNQLRRQAEYKSAINEVPAVEPKDDDKDEDLFSFKPAEETFLSPKFMLNTADEAREAAAIIESRQSGREKYQHINSLIKSGISIEEIAKTTGLSRGEIELIRNIKK
jgi:uncharacterized phage infection (PIP) family protein YhgE